MAWAERLPSGRYRGVYRDAGGRRRSAGTFPQKPRALRAAAAEEEQARRASWRDPDGGRRTWGSWCEEWWPTRSVEASTAKTDRGRLDRHLRPRWTDVPIGSIRRHDVKAWAAELRRQPSLGAESVKRIVHLFSASLTAAVDAELIDVNPALRMKLPSGAKDQERFLTRAEYDRIRDELETSDAQLIADFAVFTGVRPGELAGLHWHRLDLDRATVRIVETYGEADGMIKPYPKGKRARTVPLTPDLVVALRQRRLEEPPAERCPVEHRAAGCHSGLVFTTERGNVLRASNWRPRWREAVERAGLEGVRFYDLRHTYASWLLQGGVSLAEVGRLLGHVSTQTTAIYAHLAEPPNEEVLAALAAPAAGSDRPAAPRLALVRPMRGLR